MVLMVGEVWGGEGGQRGGCEDVHHERADGICAETEDVDGLIAPVAKHPSGISQRCHRVGTVACQWLLHGSTEEYQDPTQSKQPAGLLSACG